MYNAGAQGEAMLQEKPPRGQQVSLDGQHFISVPARLGKLISIALKLQARIDRHIDNMNFDFDQRVDIVKGMNCHKTTLFARGDISLEKLKNISVPEKDNGFPEIIDLANRNSENIVYSSEEIGEFIEGSGASFPMTVHVLVPKGSSLHPAHSFILLGIDELGRKVCFHKSGSHLDTPFELTTLEQITKEFDEKVPGLYLVVPMDGDEERDPA